MMEALVLGSEQGQGTTLWVALRAPPGWSSSYLGDGREGLSQVSHGVEEQVWVVEIGDR